jgi:hypothetical protein
MTPQKKIVELARGIISGEVGLIAGSRQLWRLGLDVAPKRDPDFTFFLAIDSESDHLPIGEVRQHWNPDALREKDTEIAKIEALRREKAVEICRRLIQRCESNA